MTNSGTPGTETSHFIDLAQGLSQTNRRLYQQGRDYFVKKIIVTSRDTQSGLVSVSTAPSTWPVHQGWKMAKKMWDEMRLAHGGAPGSGLPTTITPATWADFKVYLSADHRTAGGERPRDNENVLISQGEWTYSSYVSPDGTTGADEYVATLLGPHTGAVGSRITVGVVQAYEDSRRTVQTDDSGDQIDINSPWINLFDDGTTLDEIAEDIKNDNDNPPYDIQFYPGAGVNCPNPFVVGMSALAANNTPGGYANSVVVGGFNAPCGLLEIEIQSSEADDVYDVLIELAPGDYKGIKALEM